MLQILKDFGFGFKKNWIQVRPIYLDLDLELCTNIDAWNVDGETAADATKAARP